MLESEDVDEDFFTPVAGTSLANLFVNMTRSTETTTNDSLKYVPPKPQNIPSKLKQEQTKSTECIFVCALNAHEWINNVYTSRGKLGFAIMKIQKTGDHNIVLYNSNKTTLSCTTISKTLEVTIRNNTYISYYDNLRKYWSIYGTEEEVAKVAEKLKSFDVKIIYLTDTDHGPSDPTNVGLKADCTLVQPEINDRGSDTDSSINRKTKASILDRMANMGHSVLPTRALPVDRTSDSSDTMDIETQPKTVRHKPVKSIIKRNNLENIVPESQHIVETHQRIVVPKTEIVKNVPVYTSINGQLLPLTSTSLVAGGSNEMGMFISEQRISNSELRINMNRLTDKVDSFLDKINNFEHKGNTNVQVDILMKLLSEYENKIKVYEDLLKLSGENKKCENITTSILADSEKEAEIALLRNKISELEHMNQEKSDQLKNLQDEIRLLENKYADEKLVQVNNEEELLKKISKLEIKLNSKDDELANIAQKYESSPANTNMSNNNIGDKIKNIMNDTFQSISEYFYNDVTYSGENVKRVIGTAIKKSTFQALSEL